ncbi:MAG: hypothetical protein FJ220_02710, partial [Kiritimatiellaceae bacterium]|nr:hypothetical protein [Kiritimatiellaceae bacterium]
KTLNLYVNGVKRSTVTMNSKYSWIYGVRDYTNNNPSAGTPKRFYDSYRLLLPTNYPAGSTIMLKKDSDNTAAYYRIDLITLEKVGPALTQPANTLSVTSYGATGNDTTDDSTAFNNCIKACESQKKGMWIPAGKFYTKGVIFADNISIYGAGMWYTENHRIIGARHKWDLGNCTIQDLYITVPETGKTEANGHDYGLNMSGASGWLAQRVWIHRAGACFWLSGTDGTIKDCRATESWADGINLNNSSALDATKRGIRLTATNNFIIGAADDGIALNAQNGGGVTYNMVDTKIMNNTSIAVNWANGMRVAGGRNTLMQNNLITDPSDSNGIRIGQFGADGSPCESILVVSNVIRRGCGIRSTYGRGGIAVTDGAKATIKANTISDSPVLGIDVQDCTATFENNLIERPAQQGFLVKSGSSGSGIFKNNTVTGLLSGMIAYRNDARSTFTETLTGNSWQATATPPVVSFAAPVNLTVLEGTNLYVNVSATDPDGVSRVYLYKDGVELARSEGGAPYEWNAAGQSDAELMNLQPGTFTLKAKAVDTIGEYTEKSITITVQAINRAPYFTSNPFSAANATEGAAYSQSIAGQAVDPEGGTKTFSKVSGPVWLTVSSSGAIQGTPAAVDIGTNSFMVSVTDNGGLSDTATMKINVIAAPPAIPPVGSIITLKACNGKYVSATYSTNNVLIADKTTLSDYERFQVVNATNSIALKCIGTGLFVGINNPSGSKPMLASRPTIGSYEKFNLIQSGTNIAIQSVLTTNYASAISNGVAPLQANQTYIGSYEKFTWKVE